MHLVLLFCVTSILGVAKGDGTPHAGNFMANTPCFSFQGQNILWSGPQGGLGFMNNPLGMPWFNHPFFNTPGSAANLPSSSGPVEASLPASADAPCSSPSADVPSVPPPTGVSKLQAIHGLNTVPVPLPVVSDVVKGASSSLSHVEGIKSLPELPETNIKSAVPGIGNAVPGIGNAVPGIGNAVPGIGNAVPEIGNAVPGIGNAVPAVLPATDVIKSLPTDPLVPGVDKTVTNTLPTDPISSISPNTDMTKTATAELPVPGGLKDNLPTSVLDGVKTNLPLPNVPSPTDGPTPPVAPTETAVPITPTPSSPPLIPTEIPTTPSPAPESTPSPSPEPSTPSTPIDVKPPTGKAPIDMDDSMMEGSASAEQPDVKEKPLDNLGSVSETWDKLNASNYIEPWHSGIVDSVDIHGLPTLYDSFVNPCGLDTGIPSSCLNNHPYACGHHVPEPSLHYPCYNDLFYDSNIPNFIPSLKLSGARLNSTDCKICLPHHIGLHKDCYCSPPILESHVPAVHLCPPKPVIPCLQPISNYVSVTKPHVRPIVEHMCHAPIIKPHIPAFTPHYSKPIPYNQHCDDLHYGAIAHHSPCGADVHHSPCGAIAHHSPCLSKSIVGNISPLNTSPLPHVCGHSQPCHYPTSFAPSMLSHNIAPSDMQYDESRHTVGSNAEQSYDMDREDDLNAEDDYSDYPEDSYDPEEGSLARGDGEDDEYTEGDDDYYQQDYENNDGEQSSPLESDAPFPKEGACDVSGGDYTRHPDFCE